MDSYHFRSATDRTHRSVSQLPVTDPSSSYPQNHTPISSHPGRYCSLPYTSVPSLPTISPCLQFLTLISCHLFKTDLPTATNQLNPVLLSGIQRWNALRARYSTGRQKTPCFYTMPTWSMKR